MTGAQRWVRRLTAVGVTVAITMVGVGAVTATAAPATLPRYDHVVVVIMENHSADNIIANPAAPYINSLAVGGASMTQSYGVTHPSQPNYIALFSGSLQGVLDNSCPNTLPADNLGAQLISAGLGFVGYSETLPSAGYTGCTSGAYARKHAPWVNFPTVPAASNQPLTSLPADWSGLPTVSFVVPNLLNDMHDGTIGQADSWLRDRFDGYLQWAKQHNSLLIVTWDEDDNNAGNRIPTIFAGAGIRPGQYPQRIDHYSVLRTLQDMYGLPPLANSATAIPISDIWTTTPANVPPVAAFTGSCTQLVCTVDAGTSADPDGSIASYTWDWGDGATSSGVTAGHTFGTAGAKTVTLMVTDNLGQSRTTSSVLTAAPPSTDITLAADGFARTQLTGWGNATTGGTWTVSTPANASVGAGTGKLLVRAGQTTTAMLPAITSADSDVQVTTSVDRVPGGGGLYLGVIGRRTGTNLEYQARATLRSDGQVGLSLISLAGSSAVATLRPQVIVPGVTTANVTAMRIRLQVTGSAPTTIRAKAWPAMGTEPTGWQVTTTDSFPGLQQPGAVGLTPYLSSSSTITPVTVRFADFSVKGSNRSPVAAFTGSCAQLTCTVDGATSSDPDGSIASYSWNWADGGTTTGPSSSHSYPAAGTYPVTLTVTDDRGAVTTVSHVLTPTAPANVAPTAAFTASCAALTCSVDGAASVDPDGTLAGYSWDWGDGTHATQAAAQHLYSSAGTYTIRLTVSDNLGATATTSRTVTVTAPAGTPPAASFTVSCALLACNVDGSASSDPDGTVTGYAWQWGDGASSTGATSSHTYISAGSYQVTLTVTDNGGITGTTTRQATAAAPPNQLPTARITATCSSLTCSADAAGSADPDGTLVGYSWNWGDGTAATTGASSSHVYASAGPRTLTLTVSDNRGGTGTAQQSLAPTAPPSTGPFAADLFGRTVTTGWGTADQGGNWTVSGTASRYAVAAGVGSMTAKAGETVSALLPAVASSDTDLAVTVTTDKLAGGNGSYLDLIGRRVGINQQYQARLRLRADGTVAVSLGMLNGSSTVTVLKPEVAPSGLSIAGGATVSARLQVTGASPTTVRLRVWKTGTAEPATWQLTSTDSTPTLQALGAIGLQNYVSSGSTVTPVTLRVSNVSAKPVSSP